MRLFPSAINKQFERLEIGLVIHLPALGYPVTEIDKLYFFVVDHIVINSLVVLIVHIELT